MVGQGDFDTGHDAGDQFFGGNVTDRRLFVASDVAFDNGNRRMFVADIHNSRVLGFDLSTDIDDPAAIFVFGQPDFTTGGADPGDPYGNKDTPNPSFGCEEGTNACGMRRVFAVEFGDDFLFAADLDNHRVLVWDLNFGFVNGRPADFVIGQADFTSRGRNSAGACLEASPGTVNRCGLRDPIGLHYRGGQLFVADAGNHRVLVFDIASIADGMPASLVLGQADFTTRTAAAGAGGLNDPLSITSDTLGRVFVGDSGNRRVLVFDTPLQSGMAASHVLGQPDFFTTEANSPCAGGQASTPNRCGFGSTGVRVTTDPLGDRLYVSDSANSRVLVFDTIVLIDHDEAIGVLGQPGLDPEVAAEPLGRGTTRARQVGSHGIFYDNRRDRLLVADGGNHRIMVYGPNVDGVPIVVRGNPATVSSSVGANGAVTVEMTAGNLFYALTLPAGSQPLEGSNSDEIVVTVSTSSLQIQVDATLPEVNGEPGTKSISLRGGGLGGSVVCVKDHPGATFSLAGTCNDPDADQVPLPVGNMCTNAVVSSGPESGDGTHQIQVCRQGNRITLHGLRNTALEMPIPEQPDFGGVAGGDSPGLLGGGAGSVGYSAGGCGVGSGAAGGWCLLLVGAALAGLSRRRRRG